MNENFDPYYKWLGIPPKDQPPTHFRLLGIEPLETDRSVIDSAANRLMAYLKTLLSGETAKHAQRLREEVTVARRCLLDPQLRDEYIAQARLPAASAPAAADSSDPSQGDAFNPYYKWLGIPPKSQPPTHYRLLGIDPFETDSEVIDSAAHRIMAYLKILSTGDDATLAQRLLNEAAQARRCLLDAKLKAEYDAQLRAPKSPPPPTAADLPAAASLPAALPRTNKLASAPKSAAPNSAASGLSDSSTATMAAARKRRAQVRIETARKNKQTVMFASIAACVVLAIVSIGVALSSGGRDEDRQASVPATPTEKRSEKAIEPRQATSPLRPLSDQAEDEPSASRAESFTANEPISAKIATTVGGAATIGAAGAAAPPPTIVVKPPVPIAAAVVVKPPPPAPPADPFAGLGPVLPLPALALPSLAASGAQSGPKDLCPLPIVDLKDAQFTVLGAERVFGPSAKVTVAAADAAHPGRWQVLLRDGDADPQLLALFSVEQNRLRFSWPQDAGHVHADFLRNCLLDISADKHTHSFTLRPLEIIPPLTIQSEKGTAQSHAIAVAGIPAGMPCQMEVLGVSGPAPYFIASQSPQPTATGKFATITWNVPGNATAVCAQIAMYPTLPGKFVVCTRLLMQPPGEKNQKQEKVFNSSKEETRRINGIAALKQKYDLDFAHFREQLQGKPAQIQAAIASYESTHAAQKQKFESLGYLQLLNTLSLDKNVRESIRIHIRIFTTIGGRRIELLRTNPELPVKK